MRLFKKFRLLFFLLLWLGSTAFGLADGKVYVDYEKVPPSIPFQRALILHRDGVETLVLQSRYIAEERGEKIGWVVPVPAVPEVHSFGADKAALFFRHLSRITYPDVMPISASIYLGVFLISLVYVILYLVLLLIEFFTKKPERLRSNYAFLISFVALLVTISIPNLGALKSSVTVVSKHDVGIYDVKIIKAESSKDLIAWLNKNAFKADETDEGVFDQYIQAGWCFAATTVKPQSEWEDEGEAEGLFAPLVLRFPASKPVYPLALTATGNHDTTVLLYLLSDRYFSAGGRLELMFAGYVDRNGSPLRSLLDFKSFEALDDDDFFVAEDFPLNHLAKFKGTLTSEQMEEDLIFEPAPDQEKYRKRVWQW